MPKPDRVLRLRPLKEVPAALAKLRRVVLFHPKPVVEQLPPKMCVCGQPPRVNGKKSKNKMQCPTCWEWFHFDCIGLDDDTDMDGVEWECEWCLDVVDREGFQRWRTDRKRPKKRHQKDVPRLKGGAPGEDPLPRWSAPRDWDGKVAEVEELARRAAVKNRKLTEAVEQLFDEGGHHLADAEGLAGLEARTVDEAVIDEVLAEGLVQIDDDDDEE